VKCRNNILKQDRRFIRMTRRALPFFLAFHTAEEALERVEALHMMRRGQLKRLDGRDAIGQAKVVASLCGVATWAEIPSRPLFT